jgi:hypothetical protein
MRPPIWLVAIVALVAVTGALRVLGDTPPTSVDGLRVMTVSEVLSARASGELRNQPVAVGGYWSDDLIGHSCAAAERQALQPGCHDNEYGITEMNEPMLRLGRFAGIMYRVQGPSITPYLPQDLVGLDGLYRQGPDGDHFPPIPIVVVGHFDDPLAQLCRPDLRQGCLDRLVVDRIAYLNPGAAHWDEAIPTLEPTVLPAPPVYQGS